MANNHLYLKLEHCTYLCQYHLVWTPRYRGKVLADKFIKQELKRLFKMICRWKHFRIRAWHIGDEHIHLYIIIPPKHSVSYAVEIIKGKSSAWIKKRTKKFPPGSLWARGYFVSTVGADEIALRTYLKDQDKKKVKLPLLPLWKI